MKRSTRVLLSVFVLAASLLLAQRAGPERAGADQLRKAAPVSEVSWVDSRGQEQRVALRAASRSHLFPWSQLAVGEKRSLVLASGSGEPARVRLLMRDRSEETVVSGSEPVITPVDGPGLVAVESDRPVVGYLAWERDGEVVWVDPGEEGPQRLHPGRREAVWALALTAPERVVGLQVELSGEGIELVRAESLRQAVSLIQHGEGARLRAAWMATDLEPLETDHLGWVLADRGKPPRLVSAAASDADGQALALDVELIRVR